MALAGTTACGEPATPANERAPAGPRHAQIVRAMLMSERRALVARFVERNPGWSVNEAALGSTAVVDPFAGFLRRARAAPRADAPPSARIDEDAAIVNARAFLRKNADLFGLPRIVAIAVAEHARDVAPVDHASARAAFVVELRGSFPTKGYESFRELANEVSVDVVIDDDGTPSSVVNVSKIHPRLTIDTRPLVAEDDPRLYKKLLGRRVFALDDDERKVELGVIQAKDLIGTTRYIDVSDGPLLAWVTYRLARVLVFAKGDPTTMPGAYLFSWVVDADTGDVLRETLVPTRTTLGVLGYP